MEQKNKSQEPIINSILDRSWTMNYNKTKPVQPEKQNKK